MEKPVFKRKIYNEILDMLTKGPPGTIKKPENSVPRTSPEISLRPIRCLWERQNREKLV